MISVPRKICRWNHSGFLLEFRRFKIFKSTLKNVGILEGNKHLLNEVRMKTAPRRKIFTSVGITGMRQKYAPTRYD